MFLAYSRSSGRDPVQVHHGMTVFSCFRSSWRASGQDLVLWCEKRKQLQVPCCKLQVIRARAKKLSKSFETVFSVDGGPLTDNVVLSSVQRVLGLNRSAELLTVSGSFEQTAALPRTASSDLTRPLTPDPVLPCASYPRRGTTTGLCEGETGTRIVTGFQKASCPLRTPVLS